MAFKRASLNGSKALFQPTRVGGRAPEPARAELIPTEPDEPDERPAPWEGAPAPRATALLLEVASIPSPNGHLYRLTDEEVETILAALQQAKFPHSYQRLPKPPLEEFERLEALRQKLGEQRGAGA